MKIKICGLSRPQDIEYANRYMPDYIGFVFAAKSKRYVTPQLAAELKAQLDPPIQAVGVFVNASEDLITELVHSHTIDVVQLHGQENNHYIEELRQQVTCPIIQAFRISTSQDIEVAKASAADFILLDNGAGGTGQTFDWSLIEQVDRPFFLAGGLTPENVRSAIGLCTPYGVDTSSGVETDGLKDEQKIKAFIAASGQMETINE